MGINSCSSCCSYGRVGYSTPRMTYIINYFLICGIVEVYKVTYHKDIFVGQLNNHHRRNSHLIHVTKKAVV